jgi:hypothetical protein
MRLPFVVINRSNHQDAVVFKVWDAGNLICYVNGSHTSFVSHHGWRRSR